MVVFVHGEKIVKFFLGINAADADYDRLMKSAF